MNEHHYYVYILTNPSKTSLYVGVTNDLQVRMQQHYENRGNPKTFAGKYYCYLLVWYEFFENIDDAITREKEIKKWRRSKKNALINCVNRKWHFLKIK